MSSFYGGGGIGGGTDDYNELSNVPVKNVHGIDAGSPIILSGLGYGHYNLTGFYKQDSSSEIHDAQNDAIDVLVIKDKETGYKTILYYTIQLGTPFLNTIAYGASGIVSSHTKFPMKGTEDGQMDYSDYIFWGEVM